MDYPIAIDPHLALDLGDFIAAWNDTPQCRALATSSLPLFCQGSISISGTTDFFKAQQTILTEYEKRKPPVYTINNAPHTP